MSKQNNGRILLFFLLIILSFSCINKYRDFEIKSSTELLVPLAFGEYTLGDLFYGIEEPKELNIDTGSFYHIDDTIAFQNPAIMQNIDVNGLTFRSNNLMPFQVDLKIIPFDTLSNSQIGDAIYITIVEAAEYNESALSLDPVLSVYTLTFDENLKERMSRSNALLVDATFVWPYEKVVTSIIDNLYDLYAFNIKIIVNVSF